MAIHSSNLAWKIPCMEEPGGLQSIWSRRVGHDWATSLSLFTFMHWRRKWQPHFSVLAWRIPGTAEPGGLLSMGSHRVRHDWSDLAAAAGNPRHLEIKVRVYLVWCHNYFLVSGLVLIYKKLFILPCLQYALPLTFLVWNFSWPLNNMGLNCTGLFTSGVFQ